MLLDELYRTFIRRFYERRSTGLAYLGLMLRHPVHLVHVLRHIGQFAPYLRWVRTGRR